MTHRTSPERHLPDDQKTPADTAPVSSEQPPLGLRVFSERLLQFSSELSDSTLESARRCIVDAVGCAASGMNAGSYPMHMAAATDLFHSDRATAHVWFSGTRASLLEAAYLNSVAVSADDLDDGNRSAAGHPGGAVVPAVLAVAEHLNFTGDLRPAVAVGYEAGVVLATTRHMGNLHNVATGRWAAMAVAAAAATLSGWDATRMADAIAHAGSLSPQLVVPDPRATDGLKEGTPWAVVAGLMAWRLAAAGMPAPLHLLERALEYAGRIPTLGQQAAINQTYFKRYACCRWTHPVLDLFFEDPLLSSIDPGDIERIEVTTFDRSLMISNNPAPPAVEDAHYSFQFCTALAALGSPADFLPLTPDTLTRTDVLDLAQRVTLLTAPDLSAAFPERTPVRLRVYTKSAEYTFEALTARGDPILPLSDEELEAKYAALLNAVGIEPRHIHATSPLTLATLTPLVATRAFEDAPA